MSTIIGGLTGLLVKFILMAAVALGLMYAARVGGNKLVRSNPHWTKMQKKAAHSAAVFAAVVVFALFLIQIAR